MKDPTKKDPNTLVIKVTDNADRCYFACFDRVSHELLHVDEYKRIYVPRMGLMSTRIQAVVNAATTRLTDTTPEATTGEVQ